MFFIVVMLGRQDLSFPIIKPKNHYRINYSNFQHTSVQATLKGAMRDQNPSCKFKRKGRIRVVHHVARAIEHFIRTVKSSVAPIEI